MGQLTNQYVSSSYQGLLKMTDSTQGLTNTLQTIQTGDGDNSPLQMSFTEVNISGSFFINNVPITNGTNGTSGTSGSSGSDGSSGTSGSNGSSGTSGSNGSSGTSGSNGSDGSSGTSGGTGSSGTSGSNGSSGTSGVAGSSGSDGSSGTSGVSGSAGTSGSNGTDGSSGTSGLTDKTGLITTGSLGTSQDISGSLTDFGGNIFIAQSGQTVPFRITGSQAGGNIIMGFNGGSTPTQTELTGSWSITGSNNIIMNGLIPDENYIGDPGMKAYLSGSNNILFGQPSTQNGILVQSSSVMLPTMNSNILGGYVNLTFTSSSLAKPTFSNNIGAGTIVISHQSGSVSMTGNFGNGGIFSTANRTTLGLNTSIINNLFTNSTTLNHNSSSISYQGNLGGAITVNNNYSSSVSTAVNNITVGQNTFGGVTNTILVSGSNSGTRRTFTSNIIYGRLNEVNSIYSGSFTGGHLVATSILGQNLIVSASNTSTTIGGSTFVGRFNATGSLQESSQDTVFVVGTGGSASTRRNALRIDSNNNSNFTGSVNISGSLTLNGVSVSSDRNGLITTGSFGGAQSITGSLTMTNGGITMLGGGANLNIQSGSINLNNDGQSSIANQGSGRNVMYVDNIYSNFFFGNVPKGQSGRFSGDTNNFVLSPTYSNFQTGSNNLIFAVANSFFQSGSNNIFIGDGQPFGNSVNDSLYIGMNENSNQSIITKRGGGTSFPIQLGFPTQVTGSLNVSSLSTSTGSFIVTTDSTGTLTKSPYSAVISNLFSVGDFYSTQTQTLAGGVSGSLTYNNTGTTYGVSLVSGSQLTIANAGVYNIQFSAQILSDSGADDVWFWLKKNGTNISDTAGRVTLANNDELMAAWNYLVSANAGDYFELVWQNLNGHAELLYNASSGNIPAVPSIIITVTQVR